MEQHLPVLHAFVGLNLDPHLRTKEAVSDVVQSSVRELYANADRLRYEGDPAFKAYLCRVAFSKLVAKRRRYSSLKRHHRREVPMDATTIVHTYTDGHPGGPSEDAIRREELTLLAEAIDELDERDRRILTMRKLLGVSTAEIAEDLALADSTVRKHLGRIMARLAGRLGD